MANPLYDVPGLGGFLAAQDRRRAMGQQDMEGNIQQMKLADLFNARQDEQKLQQVMQQTGGDPSKAIQALLAAGTPKSIELASKLDGLIKKPKWNVTERYNEQTGMPEKVLMNENDPSQTQPFGGQKSQKVNDGSPPAPYIAPLDTDTGIYEWDYRTGKRKLATDPLTGKPLIKSSSSAALQGEIAGAKESGQAKAKRAMNMAGLGDTIDQARVLLSGSSGKALPTGSGIGNLYDTAAGAFGASPEGAAEADSLRALGGALTSKMPRMEGPQSDRDTQLYKEMAGVVGNANIPRERRLAALKTVEDLWGKYADSLTQSPASPPPSNSPVFTIKGDAEYNKLPAGSRFKGPDGQVRVKP